MFFKTLAELEAWKDNLAKVEVPDCEGRGWFDVLASGTPPTEDDCKPKSKQPTSRAWRQDLKLYDDVLG